MHPDTPPSARGPVMTSRVVIPGELAEAIEDIQYLLDIYMSEGYCFAIMKTEDGCAGDIVAAVGPYGGTIAPNRGKGP